MPYPTDESVPDRVPKGKRHQFRRVFNNAYASCMKKRHNEKACESSAFAIAYAAIGEHRLIERFAAADPTAWVRILPVGTFKRFGREVTVTGQTVQEMAANFGKVPETAVPVNAEHQDEHGKLGDVVAVEARQDGLWARMGKFIEGALDKIASGAFQYLSPEVAWGPAEYDGQEYANVLLGLALTNLPYFGNSTALYSLNGGLEDELDNSEDSLSGGNQVNESVNMPVGLFQGLLERLTKGNRGEQEGSDGPTVEEFTALQAQMTEVEGKLAEEKQAREKAEAEIADLKAQAECAQRVEKYAAVAVLDEGLPDILANMEDDKAQEMFTRLKAKIEQEKFAALLQEIGADGHGEGGQADPADALNAAIVAEMAESKLDYPAAAQKVALEKPQLAEAYRARLRGE